MKVMLLKNVDGLGLPGQVREVKPGYYRNFLSPRGMALEATESNLRSIQDRRKKLENEAQEIVNAAKALADRINGVVLNFTAKVGPNNRLFGSITSGDVAAQLAEKGFQVDRRNVSISEHIKTPGKYPATVRLQGQVTATISVVVVGELVAGAEAEEMEAAEKAPAAEEASEVKKGKASKRVKEEAKDEEDDDEDAGEDE
jgi:large subunit ribosomal protein L9